jgi:DNA repair protein RecN (Recombination protein N)
MLSHCHITHLAIVKNLDLDLQSGMTVITGETGAGKSIILDAIRLCFGDRADAALIRPGFEKADISCTFDIHALPDAIEWLSTNEFMPCDTPECLVRRILYLNGRSKAYINGLPATHQQLKALGEHLIQIHGQHQHQSLLKPSEQLRLLDAFADHLPLLSDVQKAYKQWKGYVSEKQALMHSLSTDTNRLALLRYQVAEAQELSLQPQELDHLDQQQNQLYHAQADSEEAQSTLECLSEEINSAFVKSLDALKKLTARHPSLQTPYDLLINAQLQVQEATSDLKQFCQKIDINPKLLQDVELRLSTIYDMARKHKVRPEALLAHFEALNAELEGLNNADERLAKLDEDLQKSEAAYLNIAQQLSESRLKAGETLAKKIEGWLGPLGMPAGRFAISLNPIEATAHGLESVQFCVSANPGHPMQPLNKVASGGELSRISLAIQLIVAHYLNTPTLIFDEVDVGVGGKIGAVLGQALKTLAESVQVLCITHLPQVAAFGTQHLQVTKHQHPNDTYSVIEPLIHTARVEELARMLGGMHVTQEAREHAKGLLNIL